VKGASHLANITEAAEELEERRQEYERILERQRLAEQEKPQHNAPPVKLEESPTLELEPA
jgi:hypothetical protein